MVDDTKLNINQFSSNRRLLVNTIWVMQRVFWGGWVFCKLQHLLR